MALFGEVMQPYHILWIDSFPIYTFNQQFLNFADPKKEFLSILH